VSQKRFISMMFALAVSSRISTTSLKAQPQSISAPYSNMAPLGQYLIADRQSEIALAKSAAPISISGDAEVLVLDQQGYRTAIKGTNGFACMVLRSWTAGFDDPEFWNPKIRSPICFNAPAARTYLPLVVAKTNLVLAGKSKAQVADAITIALGKKELPVMEVGAMCYMMSKQQHLSDQNGHWHPHLMFFVPLTAAKVWGANQSGSPIIGAEDPSDRLTIFLVPVGKWSDGTAAPAEH
jgi:hypothetical protein